MAAIEQQLIKVSWNDELRLLPAKSFEELIQECSTRFSTPAAVLSLTYKDSDNDTITVTSDNELAAAISLFGQTNTRPKFHLEKKAKVPLATIAPPMIAPEVIFPGKAIMTHPTNMAAHSVFLRRARQLQRPKPKTEEEKKAEEKQKKEQEKKKQQEKRVFELNHTRIVRLRWKESDGTPATSGPGCYFGLVDGKERKLSLNCGKGLKGFWLMRQLQDGDVVLSSLLCPNRFLRMKNGVLEFNTGENGPWSRWLVIDDETGEKVTGNIMETLTNGKKIKLGSKSAKGKFIGLKPAEEDKKREACSSEEGATFTLEAVENLKGVQVVRLCCSALSLVDPKTEEKEKKEQLEQKEKKQQEQKEKKEQMEKKKQEIKELMEKKLQEKKQRIEKKQQQQREKKQKAKEQSGSDSE